MMQHKEFDRSPFTNAIADYYYLLNKGYPEKGSLKMTGDRYMLSGEMRTVLYRGVFAKEKISARQQRLITLVRGKNLIIDGYNVLFTLLNYKTGRLVFISADSLCRDAGSLFGKIRKQKEFVATLKQMIQYLAIEKPANIRLFFDSPISFSMEHRALAESFLSECALAGEVHVVHSADYELKQANNEIICSSDSAILDHTTNLIYDLAHHLIGHYYKPDLLDLRRILKEIQL